MSHDSTNDLPKGETVGIGGEDGLTARLCRAVGLDPERVEGFDLSVRGGEIPELTVHHLVPMNATGRFRDDWSQQLAQVRETVRLIPNEAGEA